MCRDWQSSPSQSLDTCRMRAGLEKSEEGREYLAREQARVDARKQAQSATQAKNVLCQRNGIAHPKKCSGEWVKRM